MAAFQTLEISQHTEQFIVEALRAAGALTISLVAEVDGQVVGHIAFSPVTHFRRHPELVRPRTGVGLAGVPETGDRQGPDTGGPGTAEAINAQGCCLVGHPDYYGKFGFANAPQLVLEGVPANVFFALSFDGHMPRGTVTFHDAFRAAGPTDRAARSS